MKSRGERPGSMGSCDSISTPKLAIKGSFNHAMLDIGGTAKSKIEPNGDLGMLKQADKILI